MTRHIGATEVGQILRKLLKKEFPGVKFSVKKASYDLNIYVRWVNGPARTKVEHLVNPFMGIRHDAQTENTDHYKTEWEGEEVYFLVQYIVCERKYSRSFVEAVLASYEKRFGVTELHVDGADENAYIPFDYLHASAHSNVKELLECTDYADRHRPYEALHERHQARWDSYRQARAEEDLARQQAQAEKERLEREAREEAARQKVAWTYKGMSYEQLMILSSSSSARRYLGVPPYADARTIQMAFRQLVQSHADGRGGYTTDMDFLVQVRNRALQG